MGVISVWFFILPQPINVFDDVGGLRATLGTGQKNVIE
jgi:hypothetical protein